MTKYKTTVTSYLAYVHDIRLVSRMLRHVSRISLSNIVRCLGHGGIEHLPVFKREQLKSCNVIRFADWGMVMYWYKNCLGVALDSSDDD